MVSAEVQSPTYTQRGAEGLEEMCPAATAVGPIPCAGPGCLVIWPSRESGTDVS